MDIVAAADDVSRPGDADRPEPTRDELVAMAREVLDPAVAEAWVGLIRPAISLVRGGDGPALARFGGLPSLPDDVEWPSVPGVGPLTYVGEIDAEAVARSGLDAGGVLPRSGRVLLFDGVELDLTGMSVDNWPAGHLGAVLHVTGGRPRPAPDGVSTYPEAARAGRQVWMGPDLMAPALLERLGITADGDDWPAAAPDDLLIELEDSPLQLERSAWIGGWPSYLQLTAAEVEAHDPAGASWATPMAELARWRNLAQVEQLWDIGRVLGIASMWFVKGPNPAQPLATTAFVYQTT